MSDSSTSTAGAGGAEHIVEPPEVIDAADAETGAESEEERSESIDQPAKVMRVGAMMRQLLEELRNEALDEPGRDRMREIYERAIRELGTALSPDLRAELCRLALPFSDGEVPSEPELRVAEAQLVGWLEGLVQGIQASLFAQQMAAQNQLASMRAGLPAGQRPSPQQMPGGGPAPVGDDAEGRPGTYL